ncbi:hypothetical protein B0T16DRAFT_101179 [Cercophora newfieldiana]|uniref:Uncharacterized protein n=1 Tax=Cercophora newfieldiana TaxID=92897 RepID=A0AA39YGU1_9PEZI|nr:hypothetical protein B0T16DRAFT_101179 [Cercophora newfieldiana]
MLSGWNAALANNLHHHSTHQCTERSDHQTPSDIRSLRLGSIKASFGACGLVSGPSFAGRFSCSVFQGGPLAVNPAHKRRDNRDLRRPRSILPPHVTLPRGVSTGIRVLPTDLLGNFDTQSCFFPSRLSPRSDDPNVMSLLPLRRDPWHNSFGSQEKLVSCQVLGIPWHRNIPWSPRRNLSECHHHQSLGRQTQRRKPSANLG